MSPEAEWPWSELGLPDMPEAPKDVRRAYARALKAIDPSRDINGFTTLRRAYEQALAIVEGGNTPTPPPPAPAPQADAPASRVDNLLALLGSDAVMIGPFDQITDVLADPLVHDPAHHAAFRRQTAKLVRANYSWPTEVPGSFTFLITPVTLLALDDAFGWLSNFTEFHRDFGADLNLFDTMIRVAVTVPPLEQSGEGSKLRAAAAESLTRHIASAETAVPVNFRIAQALNSPLINEPAFAPALCAAIVQVLKQDFHDGPNAGQLSDLIEQTLLKRLEVHFGWPSKRAAFERDFGQDPALLKALKRRRSGKPNRPVPTTPESRVWHWLSDDGTAYAGVATWSGLFAASLVFAAIPYTQGLGRVLGKTMVYSMVAICFIMLCLVLVHLARQLSIFLARSFSALQRLIRR